MAGEHGQWKVLNTVKRWKLESSTVGSHSRNLRTHWIHFVFKDNIGNWPIVRTGLRDRIKAFVELKSMCTCVECKKTGLHCQMNQWWESKQSSDPGNTGAFCSVLVYTVKQCQWSATVSH